MFKFFDIKILVNYPYEKGSYLRFKVLYDLCRYFSKKMLRFGNNLCKYVYTIKVVSIKLYFKCDDRMTHYLYQRIYPYYQDQVGYLVDGTASGVLFEFFKCCENKLDFGNFAFFKNSNIWEIILVNSTPTASVVLCVVDA